MTYLPGLKRRSRNTINKYFGLSLYGISACLLLIGNVIYSEATSNSGFFEANAEQATVTLTSTPAPTEKPKDPRLTKLQVYLQDRQSPLVDAADIFIEEADKHAIDWTLMPAIACQESGCGKTLPEGSYNPFGLGGEHNMMHFPGWKEAIEYEAGLLDENYRTSVNSAIGRKYCPTAACELVWAKNVTGFSKEINK